MGQEGKTKMWRGMRRDQEGKIKHWRCGGRTGSLGGGRRKWPQTLRSLPSRRHRVDHRLAQLDTWMFSMIKKWKNGLISCLGALMWYWLSELASCRAGLTTVKSINLSFAASHRPTFPSDDCDTLLWQTCPGFYVLPKKELRRQLCCELTAKTHVHANLCPC